MKVSEIFSSIQGEGEYAGWPVLFIRLSGCTRRCNWCDSKYHKVDMLMSVNEVAEAIRNSGKEIVVWTGGEPLLQLNEIKKVIELTIRVNHMLIRHHLETNGDLLEYEHTMEFEYISCSPKTIAVAKKVAQYEKDLRPILSLKNVGICIKVVTDLKTVGVDMLKYATMLMPFTSDKDCRKEVWNYCNKHNLRYSPRLHVDIWGPKKRKI